MLAFNAIIGSSLGAIFGMINALQIIIILPLFDTSMPANTGMVFKYLTKIAAFDILEIGDYVDEFLELGQTDPVDNNFETLGFESKWFINNVGSFFIYLLWCFAIVIFYLLVATLNKTSGYCLRLKHRLSIMVFWNKLSMAIFESILVVGLSCFITFRRNFVYESTGEQVQTFSAVVSALVYISIPIYCFARLHYYFEHIHERHVVQSIGSLYDGLAVERGRVVMLEPITFLLRRLVLAILVINGSEIFFFFQMMLLMLLNMLVMIITY